MRMTLLGDGAKIEAGDGEHVVGRGEAASLRVPVLTMDKRHAKIVCASGKCTIEDLGSTSGVFVNGALTRGTVALVEGDTVTFGGVAFTVRIEET